MRDRVLGCVLILVGVLAGLFLFEDFSFPVLLGSIICFIVGISSLKPDVEEEKEDEKCDLRQEEKQERSPEMLLSKFLAEVEGKENYYELDYDLESTYYYAKKGSPLVPLNLVSVVYPSSCAESSKIFYYERALNQKYRKLRKSVFAEEPKPVVYGAIPTMLAEESMTELVSYMKNGAMKNRQLIPFPIEINENSRGTSFYKSVDTQCLYESKLQAQKMLAGELVPNERRESCKRKVSGFLKLGAIFYGRVNGDEPGPISKFVVVKTLFVSSAVYKDGEDSIDIDVNEVAVALKYDELSSGRVYLAYGHLFETVDELNEYEEKNDELSRYVEEFEDWKLPIMLYGRNMPVYRALQKDLMDLANTEIELIVKGGSIK